MIHNYVPQIHPMWLVTEDPDGQLAPTIAVVLGWWSNGGGKLLAVVTRDGTTASSPVETLSPPSPADCPTSTADHPHSPSPIRQGRTAVTRPTSTADQQPVTGRQHHATVPRGTNRCTSPHTPTSVATTQRGTPSGSPANAGRPTS